jgi:hypothetical protein
VAAVVFVESHIERRLSGRVKVHVTRVKITFVALLPAFCLVVMGQVVLVPCGNCGWIVTCESPASVRGSKECPSQPLPVADSVISAVHSRLAKQSFKAGGTEATLSGNDLQIQPGFSAHVELPTEPDITSHWLATCRKALPARAPCFVS